MESTTEYKGCTIKIIQDEDPESPSTWEDNGVFLVYDHRQFSVDVKGFDPTEIWQYIQETKQFFFDGYYVFPVYAYIHSGVVLSLGRSGWPFNCPWDTSMKGFALVERKKGWSYAKKQARKIAESLVSEWNDYLSGDVYGYQTKDADGEDIDSCWGFYGTSGEDSYIMEQAKASIDGHLNSKPNYHPA